MVAEKHSAPEISIAPDAGTVLVDRHGLAAMLGLGLSTLSARRAAGKVLDPVIDDGRVVRWSCADVRRWVDSGCPLADAWRRQARRGR